jgi:flagellar protein FlaG
MNVESLVNVSTQSTGQSSFSKGADLVNEARKQKQEVARDSGNKQQKVQPEELLQQINALTEEGLYSVRFENDRTGGGMVVKVVDRETNEVIRQIPPEELMDLTKRLNDLRGNVVNTEG